MAPHLLFESGQDIHPQFCSGWWGTWDNLLSKSAKELARSQNWSEDKISRSHQAFIYSEGTWGITTSLLSRAVIPHTPFILVLVASQQI